jgi:hypothetical protein
MRHSALLFPPAAYIPSNSKLGCLRNPGCRIWSQRRSGGLARLAIAQMRASVAAILVSIRGDKRAVGHH